MARKRKCFFKKTKAEITAEDLGSRLSSLANKFVNVGLSEKEELEVQNKLPHFKKHCKNHNIPRRLYLNTVTDLEILDLVVKDLKVVA